MTNELIVLKDSAWFERQKHAGLCVANILKECGEVIEAGIPNLSLKDLEQIAYRYFSIHNCTSTFLNYRGFPSAICTSVNEDVVHGIVTDYVLQPGDVVSVDVGATFEGAIGDAARTWIYGEPKNNLHVELLKAGKKALTAGQNAVKVGNRIGSIGFAINKFINKTRFKSIIDYGGHGLDYNKPHADPFVSNKQAQNSGVHIVPGLSIAIEPMLVIGSPSAKTKDDGFTISVGSICCHFENSVTVMEDGVYIITEIQNEIGF